LGGSGNGKLQASATNIYAKTIAGEGTISDADAGGVAFSQGKACGRCQERQQEMERLKQKAEEAEAAKQGLE